MKKNIRILLVYIALVALIPLMLVFSAKTKQVACTQEAKLCPDGSAVGRSGPNCEFTACPATAPFTGTWHTVTQGDVTFRYPEVTSTYMHPQDWPPTVTIEHGGYSCDSENEERTINGKLYCIHTQNEGAAGSVYTEYLYISPRADGAESAVLRMTFRATQCYNYDDPKKSECELEREQFSADLLADGILTSAR